MISLSGTSTSVAWFRDEWCCSAKCATSKYNSNIKVHPRENTENVWKKCTASSLRFEHVSSLKQTLQSHHMSSPLAPLVPLPLRVTGLAPRAHHRPSSSFIILHQNHQTACLLHGHQRSWACGRDPDFIRECNATRPPKICGFERVFYRNILCGFSSLIIWKIKVLERCIVFGVLILSSILCCLLFAALLVFDSWS